MSFSWTTDAEQYVSDHAQELISLLEELCRIPAPSNREELRAAFCKQWLEAQGAQGVLIDEACNVVFPYGCDGSRNIDVFMAHTDTVFPDLTPMEPRYEGDRLYCPGVGDDTANLAVLLLCAKYVITRSLRPRNGVLFVANAGEEGLGNLKGVRHIMHSYEGRVASLVSFDGGLDGIVTTPVGSTRYRLTVRTEGGHSYSSFGNKNAIACLAAIIHEFYAQTVPQNGSRTTYNVGLISGGTSVNTIAQSAECLYEYRSDSQDSMELMQRSFEEIVAAHRKAGVQIEVEVLGERPCMGEVDRAAHEGMISRFSAILERETGKTPVRHSGSTDCNIPLSVGVPAVCFGCYDGDGAHTREEYIEVPSLKAGFRVGLSSVLTAFKV